MKRIIVIVCVLMLLALLVVPVLDEVLAEALSGGEPEGLDQRIPGCACGRGLHVACAPAYYAPDSRV